MGLLRKRRAGRNKPGARLHKLQITCAFCQEPASPPRNQLVVFSGEGCLGGRCDCGAVYVIDETGKDGGAALLDAQALACDGDLDRALRLDAKVDFQIKIRGLAARGRASAGRGAVSGYLPPKVWFLKLTA